MNAKELREIVKQIVKEEVAQQVNISLTRLLGEVLRNGVSNISTSPQQNPPQVINESAKRMPEQPATIKNTAKIITGNPALDAALANTVNDLPRDPSTSLVSMMEPLDKIGHIDEPIAKEVPKLDGKFTMDMLKSMVTIDSPQVPSVMDNPTAIPTPIKNVLNKDFRSLMRKIDEKKKSGTSMSPMSVIQNW